MTAAAFGVHAATFLNADTKIPLLRTDIISALTITDGGDLVGRRGSDYDYDIEHFQGPKTIEVQLTAKNWLPGLYQIAAGATVSQLANIASDSQVVTYQSKNAIFDLTFEIANAASLSWGSFALVYNGAKWDLYLLENALNDIDFNALTLKVGSELTLSAAASHLGNGVSAAYDAAYTTPEEGDYIVFSVVPEDAAAIQAYTASVAQGARRPYVSGIFAAEAQGSLLTIHVPRMKCSSGIPFALNDKTDNEYQLTFMGSALKKGDKLWEIVQKY